MNDMASTRKMGPLVPCGLWEESAGLAAAETEGDFGVFFVEGKRRFYQEKSFEFRVSRPECTQTVPRARSVKTDRLAFTRVRVRTARPIHSSASSSQFATLRALPAQ